MKTTDNLLHDQYSSTASGASAFLLLTCQLNILHVLQDVLQIIERCLCTPTQSDGTIPNSKTIQNWQIVWNLGVKAVKSLLVIIFCSVLFYYLVFLQHDHWEEDWLKNYNLNTQTFILSPCTEPNAHVCGFSLFNLFFWKDSSRLEKNKQIKNPKNKNPFTF